jgi:hypothetical protein
VAVALREPLLPQVAWVLVGLLPVETGPLTAAVAVAATRLLELTQQLVMVALVVREQIIQSLVLRSIIQPAVEAGV